MQLVPLAITCNAGACPTVYTDADDTSTLWVQGWEPSPDQIRVLPTGEAMVRIPRDLLVDAASSLQNEM
jgi:hypothetical protein